MRVSLALVLIAATSLPFHSVRSESLLANRQTGIITGGVALICLILGADSYVRARRLEKKQFPTPQEKKDRKKLKVIAGIFGGMSAVSALTTIASTIAYLRKPVPPVLRLRLERMPSGDILLTPKPWPELPVLAARPPSPRRPNGSAVPDEWVIYLRELAQWMRERAQHDPDKEFDLLLNAQECDLEAQQLEHKIKLLAESKEHENDLFVSPVSARTAPTSPTPASTPRGWWSVSPFTPRSAAQKQFKN